MIPRYTDHAANERTFLAWVRTGIAVIAFGFVIERFDLFLMVAANSMPGAAVQGAQVALSKPLGKYGGAILIAAGLVLILTAVARFVRTGRRLDDPATYPASDVRAEVVWSSVIVLLIGGFSAYLVLG